LPVKLPVTLPITVIVAVPNKLAAGITPLTPSTSKVLSSANTLPVTSPSSVPVCAPAALPVTLPTNPVDAVIVVPSTVVAVTAAGVTPPSMPVNAASTVPATNVSAPIVHLSVVSFHINVFAVALPLLILMPLSCVGATATPKLLLRLIILSARLISSVLTVVVVPVTV